MSYLIRRLEFFFITLWAALTMNFIIPRVMPGSPAEAMLVRFHGRASPEAVKTMEMALGFHTNENIFQQYGEYIWNTIHLNLGTSLSYFPLSVNESIMYGLFWTLGLVGVSTVIAFVLGTLIGIVSAWRRGGWLDGILPTVFVVAEVSPRVSGYIAGDAEFAFAFEKRVGAHVFSLTFANSSATTYGQLARGGSPESLYLGFNLARKFY